ncbi:MAG: HDIG domain-containing protein [Chloroflexota bacterium]|nr:HDIG domain-containing protein [Chloroflexota bacterium]
MEVWHRVEQTRRYARGRGADERHAARTAEILRARGADAELVLAGLLHDVAKPAETRLWHRVAGVLLEPLPVLRRRLAGGDGVLARYLDHARRGAEEARRRGAPDRVARLIARHHDRPRTADERALHDADRAALP